MGFLNFFKNVEQTTPPLTLTRVPDEKKDGRWMVTPEMEIEAEMKPRYENDPEMIKKISEQKDKLREQILGGLKDSSKN